MNIASTIAPDAPVAIDVTQDALASILRPDCAAAIWARKPEDGFQDWIDGLPAEQLPKARVILRPNAVRDTMTDLCGISGMPDGPERTMLIDDVAALAKTFAEIMETPFLRLRLDVVTTNACRKFHIDAVTARLICTYRGSGTQYGFRTDGGDPQQVFAAPTGAPVMLRGTLWPTRPDPGLLHRSPPIEGTGETRLMLVLDPVAALQDEPQHHLH